MNDDDFQEVARVRYTAPTWFVSAAGSDSNNGKRPGTAKATLAGAIAAATAGDTIIVGPGTFVNAATTTVDKRLRLIGAGMHNTILMGQPGTGDAALVVHDWLICEDLTLQGNEDGSAALSWEPSASSPSLLLQARFRHVRFYNRATSLTGAQAAIFIYAASSPDGNCLFLEDCHIDADGFGIFEEDGQGLVVRNCRFDATVCISCGGGEQHNLIESSVFQFSDRIGGNEAIGFSAAGGPGRCSLVHGCIFLGTGGGDDIGIEAGDVSNSNHQVLVTDTAIRVPSTAGSKAIRVVGSNAKVLLGRDVAYDPTRISGNVELGDGLTSPTARTSLAGITSLPNWLRALALKNTPDATALSEINSGSGTYDPTTDSLEAIRDNM